jgi:hypothetical protein
MTTAAQPAFPGLPKPSPNESLWAVHHQGSDDILAMPSREMAEASKAAFDAEDERTRAGERGPYYPLHSAVVVPWPSSPEAHARQLAERGVVPA